MAMTHDLDQIAGTHSQQEQCKAVADVIGAARLGCRQHPSASS